MEKLRIKIGKKKTVSAMVDEFTIGGTTDHNLLKNRDMNNQHPINAITGLEDALDDRVTNENLIAEVDSALKSAKDSGLFNGKDGKDGHTPQKGIDYFDGEPGDDGVGILSIEQEFASNADGGENIIKITLTDGRVQRFIIKNGSGGEVEISQYDVLNALGYTPIDRENIVDDLETNVANYPLSAAQGAKLKRLIDDITVPTKTSQLTNDSKFMSTEEVVAKINEAISGVAGGLKFEIVDAIEDLPTWCDDSNTIYLVPSEKTESNQYYNEYLWMDGRWEKFGDTQISLSNYYTQSQVDNLILNIQKSIPTKISQLYNDAGYVKAEDIETGKATWDSLKGNILETIETPITWDGNTEGLETHPRFTAFYKVSDVVLSAEDAVGLRYKDSKNNRDKTIPVVGNGLANTIVYDTYWIVVYGIICVYDEGAGCSTGLYFYKGTFDDGTENEYHITEFILENEKVKPELLPENIGGGSAPLEGMTVKRREFTSHADLHSFLSENCENVLKAMLRLLYEEAGTVYIEDMVYTNVSKLDYGDSYSFALSKNEYNFGFDGSTTPDLYFTAGRIEVKENGGHFSRGNYWLKHSADTGFTYEADEDATSMNFDDEILASMGGRYIIFYAD